MMQSIASLHDKIFLVFKGLRGGGATDRIALQHYNGGHPFRQIIIDFVG